MRELVSPGVRDPHTFVECLLLMKRRKFLLSHFANVFFSRELTFEHFVVICGEIFMSADVDQLEDGHSPLHFTWNLLSSQDFQNPNFANGAVIGIVTQKVVCWRCSVPGDSISETFTGKLANRPIPDHIALLNKPCHPRSVAKHGCELMLSECEVFGRDGVNFEIFVRGYFSEFALVGTVRTKLFCEFDEVLYRVMVE